LARVGSQGLVSKGGGPGDAAVVRRKPPRGANSGREAGANRCGLSRTKAVSSGANFGTAEGGFRDGGASPVYAVRGGTVVVGPCGHWGFVVPGRTGPGPARKIAATTLGPGGVAANHRKHRGRPWGPTSGCRAPRGRQTNLRGPGFSVAGCSRPSKEPPTFGSGVGGAGNEKGSRVTEADKNRDRRCGCRVADRRGGRQGGGGDGLFPQIGESAKNRRAQPAPSRSADVETYTTTRRARPPRRRGGPAGTLAPRPAGPALRARLFRSRGSRAPPTADLLGGKTVNRAHPPSGEPWAVRDTEGASGGQGGGGGTEGRPSFSPGRRAARDPRPGTRRPKNPASLGGRPS